MNQYRKILVTGATGFIGSRLCERLLLDYHRPYRALVRHFTRANRIARLRAELAGGDLLEPASIRSALEGCDAVVHLAHSDDQSAPRETRNLLQACRQAGIRRLVHMSSIAVHGPAPGPEAAREETAAIKRYGEAYCDSKAEVEEIVQRAVRQQGLPGVILRPALVYGPYSPFVVQITSSARDGEVSLIDQGQGLCNAVYVDDVCDAIHAALTGDAGLGTAFFVAADRAVTWRDFILTFATMVDPPPRVRDFHSEDIRRHWAARKPTVRSNGRAMIRLATSPEFHQQLSTVPALGVAIRWAKQTLTRILSEEKKLELKRAAARSRSPASNAEPAWPNPGRLIRETCAVEFSNARAKQVLGWRPAYDLPKGARLTKTWLEFARELAASRGHNG